MTDQKCNPSLSSSIDPLCGYIQPGSVAYRGFDGADKTFLLEFSMPHDPVPGQGLNYDMPAVWMLNARIPLTQQYGNCSCWASGCGEFDVFEVLSPGSTKAKSTFHSVFRGGDSNYFERPVDGTIRVAVVYDSGSSSVAVKVLGRGGQGEGSGSGVAAEGEFPEVLTAEEIQGLLRDGEGGMGQGSSSSFKIARVH